MKIIKSLQNSHFKKLKKLSNNKFNKKEREFIIEGVKEIALAVDSNIKIRKIYFRNEKPMELDISISKEIEIFYLNKKLFDLLTYRSSSSKVIAVADKKSYSLDDIYLKKINTVNLRKYRKAWQFRCYTQNGRWNVCIRNYYN